MTDAATRLLLWSAQDALRRRDWPQVDRLGRALAAAPAAGEPSPAAAGRLLVAFASGLGRPDGAERFRAVAAAALPGFDRYRYLDDALGAARPARASDAQALDCLLTFAAADVFLLEYPKCGRTWLRTMIGRTVERIGGVRLPDPADLRLAARAVPRLPAIEVSHDDYPQLKPADRVATDKRIYADHRVLLLVRDPRDVLVSLHFQRTRRGEPGFGAARPEETLSDLVRGPVGGLASLVAFYNAWAAARAVPRDFLLVTYEELHADTAATLARVLAFAGFGPVAPAIVDAVVAECAFDRMRAAEAAGAFVSDRLRPRDADDPESYKARRGRVGGFVDYLGAEDRAWIDARLAADLDPWFAAYRP
ncbi:sulfotransferase domain-containing protein [Stella sp.]|uniref:sulfotransferase domain-containing protein n=1 Tax=Stella sp. TaxID=2912054 RepID=UPI0035B47E65